MGPEGRVPSCVSLASTHKVLVAPAPPDVSADVSEGPEVVGRGGERCGHHCWRATVLRKMRGTRSPFLG